jgi:EpsI family protein
MDWPNNKKYIPVIVILVIALISLVYIIVPQNAEKAVVHLDQFPNQIGEWRGVDIEVGHRTYEILNPDGLLFKEYTNKRGENVQLVIVLGLNKRESFHPPEVCYSGGGLVQTKEFHNVKINSTEILAVNKLLIGHRKDALSDIVFFWFTSGDKHFASYYRQQMNIVWNEFKNHKSWGSLIRISTFRMPNEDDQHILNRLESFTREIYPLLPKFVNPKG